MHERIKSLAHAGPARVKNVVDYDNAIRQEGSISNVQIRSNILRPVPTVNVEKTALCRRIIDGQQV
jgi:hypothetical protein